MITFRLCLAIVVLFLNVSIQAREVVAFILSIPAGATIIDGGQSKPKILGRAPLRVTVEVDNVDYRTGVLQDGRYFAKWTSGAISRVLKYATPLGESEFVYVIERPAGAEGETKDQTAGQAHARKHDVAALSQEIEAKYKAFQEKIAMLREKQKEEARLAEEAKQQEARLTEERKQQEMLLAAEQRQRELADARARDELAVAERRVARLKMRQEEAKEILRLGQETRTGLGAFLSRLNGSLGSNGRWDPARSTSYDASAKRDDEAKYERERACVRDLNRCDY